MKTKLSLLFLLSFVFYLGVAQIPQGFNYQAIARDGVSGNPITDPVDIKIDILASDASTIIREELHSGVDPDEHGLFSLVVGQGSYVSGLTNFSDIDWTVTPKYIKTLIWYGGEWKDMGPAQLWSVPYAMYSPSTNPWLTNGSNLYYSSGNVGIGTANPIGSLGLWTNGGGTYLSLMNSSTGGRDYLIGSTGLGNGQGEGKFVIWDWAASANRFTIDKDGRVGIGTVNPNFKLEVKGGESHFAYNGGNSSLRFTTGYNNSFMFQPLDHALQLQTDHTGNPVIMYIYKAGQIGIGNSDPAYILDVSGRSRFRAGGGSAGFWLMNNANTLDRSFFGMYEDDYVGFYGQGGAGWGLLMNVNNGNVGIGTTTPGDKLHVNGGITSSSLIIGSGLQTTLRIVKTDNLADQRITELVSLGASGNFIGRFTNDAYTMAENWLNVSRNPGTYTVQSVTIPSGKFAIGTSTPTGMFEIATPGTWPDETPLFEVKNRHGIPVFAVYNNGVRINVEYDPDGVKGPKGGFAIGGYDYTKGGTYLQTLMNVTPDSIRFNINNNTTGKGPKGGFAIGGFGTTKGSINEDFLYITPQSSNGGNYSTKMGFEAGKNSNGPHNTFVGFYAGKGTTGNNSASNIFIGEASGKNNSGSYTEFPLLLPDGTWITAFNSWGGNNVAVGNYTGVNLKGDFLHQSYGQRNVLLGHSSGTKLETGSGNVIIGHGAGSSLVSGNGNIFIGSSSGANETASNKLFIDNSNTSAPLIYGDFYDEYVRVNGWLEVSGYESEIALRTTSGTSGKRSRLSFYGTFTGGTDFTARNFAQIEVGSTGGWDGGFMSFLGRYWNGSGEVLREVMRLNTYNGDLTITGFAYKPGGGSWLSSSDFYLKDIKGEFVKGLEEILELNPVLFSYKKGNPRNLPANTEYVGFVAQDVRTCLPEAVSVRDDGYLDLDMHVINVALVNAVKEQQTEIEKLHQQVDELMKMVGEMNGKVASPRSQ